MIRLKTSHVLEIKQLASPDRSVMEIRRMMTNKVSETRIYQVLQEHGLPYRKRRPKPDTPPIFDSKGRELFNIDAYKNCF